MALLTAFAILLRGGPVETDLAKRAGDALATAQGWAKVELDGRDLTLSGTAPTPEGAAEALKLAAGTYGVRTASSATAVLPLADPYALSMEFSGDKLALAGSFPSEKSREAVVAALGAVLPGVAVADAATLSRGAPEGFDDLAGFAASMLGSFSKGTATISGTRLSLSGIAKSGEAFDAVGKAISGALPGGGTLAKAEITPAIADPYLFEAARTESGAVSLTGFIPDEALRGTLAEAAKLAVPGAMVEDKLQLASGAPEGFAALTKFAVDSLASLKQGAVAISGSDLSLTGLAASPEAMAAIEKSLAVASAAGGKIALMEIKAPEKPAKKEAKVVKPEPAPAPAPEPAKPLVIETPALPSAAGQIAGTAPQVAAEPAPAPQPEPVAPEPVPAVVAQDCQKAIDAVLTGQTIQFEKGSADISGVSLPLLDKIATTAGDCVTARIAIGGHTDSDGQDADNLKLSNDRAAAVAGYLVKAGVDAARLDAEGFGESQPVAENDTPEGKAKNRRIEFRVLK